MIPNLGEFESIVPSQVLKYVFFLSLNLASAVKNRNSSVVMTTGDQGIALYKPFRGFSAIAVTHLLISLAYCLSPLGCSGKSLPALCHCNPFWADPAPLQKGRASYRHQNLQQAFASLQWGGMNVLSFVGWGSPFTPRTHVSHCLSGISLNLIFWYNLFPVLKKHLSSTLVHYHLG